MGIPGLVHRVQNTPMHWFQTVARIWNRTTDDDRHGVVEIASPHLIFDRDGGAVIGGAGGRFVAVAAVDIVFAQLRYPADYSLMFLYPLGTAPSMREERIIHYKLGPKRHANAR